MKVFSEPNLEKLASLIEQFEKIFDNPDDYYKNFIEKTKKDIPYNNDDFKYYHYYYNKIIKEIYERHKYYEHLYRVGIPKLKNSEAIELMKKEHHKKENTLREIGKISYQLTLEYEFIKLPLRKE